MQISNTYFHITRYTYKKIYQEIPSIDLNRMIWDNEIYLNNKSRLVELKRFNNGTLYELVFNEYRLFFIREQQQEPYRNNVFWVNILQIGTKYDQYKNESIITFKFGEFQKGNRIIVNDKIYTAVHTGNSYNRYCQLAKQNSSKVISEKEFWNDIEKNLNGDSSEIEFITSTFGDYMIVHGLKK